MTLSTKKLERLERLANLPAEAAQRRRFVAGLASCDPAIRARWLELTNETELLRAALARAPVPAGLEDRILAIPRPALASPRPSIFQSFTSFRPSMLASLRVPMPAAAAVILAVLGTGTYLALDHGPTRHNLPAAPAAAVSRVALLAGQLHINQLPLQVESSEQAVVAKSLQARAPAMEVEVPTPGPGYHLLGGSICTLGTVQAVYTRWQHDGRLYSLFEFASGKLGLPAQFATTGETPLADSGSLASLRMSLWSGDPVSSGCAWALVTERDAPVDAFENCGW